MRIPLLLAVLAAFAATSPAQLLPPAELSKAKTFTSLEEAAKTPLEVRKLRLLSLPLAALPPEILAMTNLQELSINNCKNLKELPAGLAKLPYLQLLNVNNNALTSLPPELGSAPSLEKLQCGSNPLTTLPAEFAGLKKLKTLEIVSAKFTEVPACVPKIATLVDLNLNSNKLAAVPAALGDLSNLQELGLMYGAYTQLPPELGKLTKLRRLHLNDGKLTALPPELGKLAALEWLSFANNDIKVVPPELGRLGSLRDLLFGGNPLADLKAAFTVVGQMSKLTRVAFDGRVGAGTAITLPAEIASWQSVENLSLSWLTLPEPAEALKKLAKLPRLKTLSLARCKLGTLPPEIGQLAALTMIYLDGNELTALPDAFRQLTKIEFVFASSDNKFTPEEKAKWPGVFPKAKIDLGK